MPFTAPQKVWLYSVADRFSSKWDSPGTGPDDRQELRRAVGRKDALSVLYRAKRLLQTNSADTEALHAVRDVMGGNASRVGQSRILTLFFADPSVGQEFVRGAVLIERARNETLCRAGDDGRRMFLVLRGQLVGFLPSLEDSSPEIPDFEVGPGELVGEMAFALKTKRNATLLCADDCSLLAFGRDDLLRALNESPLLVQVTNVVDLVVNGRIIQNTCRLATYLSGPQRKGPLGAYERPWNELEPHCRTIQVDWRKQDLDFDTKDFTEDGLYILVAGVLETQDKAVLYPQQSEPPILAVNLSGQFQYRLSTCRLLDDVTILCIRRSGLEQFGPIVYRQLVAELRARAGGALRVKSNPGGARVEGVLRVGGADAGSQTVDVVFIHGLDGDARTTWHPKDSPDLFWPAWLAEDVPGTALWSLEYEVSSSSWKGTTMPLSDRATNVLARLEAQGIGGKSIIFICHSLGGLLVKQMLRNALDFGLASWKAIAQRTRGIVFLSTPHSGSDISNWLKYLSTVLRLTESVDELRAHDPRLRELNTWFRNCPLTPKMHIQVYCEKLPISGLLVVNESSADPGLPGVVPIPLDENHISICKPNSREKLVYSRVKSLVSEVGRSA
jgi:hypothetical protein